MEPTNALGENSSGGMLAATMERLDATTQVVSSSGVLAQRAPYGVTPQEIQQLMNSLTMVNGFIGCRVCFMNHGQ